MDFNKAFELVIGHEGGYVNDPRDPGGETKYGICKREYPNEDIKNLTLDRARVLYRRDYWDKVSADKLPWHWAYPVFDCAVNQGPGTAVRLMQDALGVMVDGKIGPRTVAAAWKVDTRKLGRFFALRALRYAKTNNFDVYGYGWMTRLFTVSFNANVNETLEEVMK
jgi:lysozyme family protein